MTDGPSRKRPLDVDTQASVWVVMRNVMVPTEEEWGEAPNLQVALSGVFATKEAAEEECAKHCKALAKFCKERSEELKTEEGVQAIYEKHGCQLQCGGHFKSSIRVVEMPLLTASPSTEPTYKLDGKKEMRVVLSDTPDKVIFTGPHGDCMSGYSMDCQPKTYCDDKDEDENKLRDVDEDEEAGEGADEESDEDAD